MKRLLALTVAALLSAIMIGCSGSSNTLTTTTGAQPGNVFVTGEDAPLPSVVGFDVTINSITLNGESDSPVVMSTPTTVDFARLVGLRSPLAFNVVPADTYNSATFVLTNPVISFVDLTQNPPALSTITGTLPTSPTYFVDGEFPKSHGGGSQRARGIENGIRHSAVSACEWQRTSHRRGESGHLREGNACQRS
ncbi:MAG: hypothetical protein WBQ08_11005 [Candidatus Sulfotelmatobacter sp.]